MAGVYSVGQVNVYIKNMFTQDILLGKLSVKGEVSNCKYHTSGHVYFTLKDQTGTLACVMFASNRKNLEFTLSDGQEVVVTGGVNVYERDGRYQLYASKIEQSGSGDLFKKYQKLKDELEEMGMFADEYKKMIPKYGTRIGIVTAQTGAAIRDIINIATRRNPYVELFLYSAIVQGEAAPISIVKGIKYLDNYGVDTIIVGRGGGSIEDLWAFNEEIVARAIFDCNTPIISAVGHETDFTIADFVSDLRAPTPSAAAELAVFDYMALCDRINQSKQDIYNAMMGKINDYRYKLSQFNLHFKYLNPENILNEKRMTTARLEDALNKAMSNALINKRHKLALLAERLSGVSPLNRLSAGFSYVEDERGNNIRSINDVKVSDKLNINVSDGSFEAVVTQISSKTLVEEDNNGKIS